MSAVGCTVSLKPKLDFETHQFKKRAWPLPLQLSSRGRLTPPPRRPLLGEESVGRQRC
jgi:hypothetical protein